MPSRLLVPTLLVLALAACGGDSNKKNDNGGIPPVTPEATPSSINLSFLGRHSSGVFGESAAEIVVFDPDTKRAFVVNAKAGELDVLNLEDPANPSKVSAINVSDIAAGATVNSVAIHGGIVAIAIEAAVKTDAGFVALYNASDLTKIAHVSVGALPDMLTFTPDGKYLLVANEGEPSDDYSVDPEGSISIIDVADLSDVDQSNVRTASFSSFNDKREELIKSGVRIFGPSQSHADGRATVAEDLEPEYIAVSSDGKTAWAALQENNAVAVIDIEAATVTDILPLGFKNHGLEHNAIDVSDGDRNKDKVKIEIAAWPSLKGMYHPDGMIAYEVDGKTYLVTANEGDARAWGEETAEYFGTLKEKDIPAGGRCDNDNTKGFVEEWRVKHLVHKNGFNRRCQDDLPAHLRDLAAGAHLNPDTFEYCGATKGDPGDCRDDFIGMGRLLVSWTMGYQKNEDGSPVYYTKGGDKVDGAGNPLTDYLMYDELYAFGARSFAIWDPSETAADGSMKLVYESGDFLEQHTASEECMLGGERLIPCKDFFNSNHSHGDSMDRRSVNKGPEPEGLVIGQIGSKQFLFLGLERMGGVMVFDVTSPESPRFQDYLNTRENWLSDPEAELSNVGDLGVEGLFFVPAKQSPNGKPLVITGNEVSGTTAIFEIEQQF